MAKLSSERRDKLKKSSFGMPGERKYPMPDKSHARNAKARASEMEHKGKLSPSEKSKIDAKADRILGNHPKHNEAHHHKMAHKMHSQLMNQMKD